MIAPGQLQSSVVEEIQLIRIVGIITVLFFGGCFIWILKKIFDSKVGLLIDEKGIIDNSSGVSIGFIPWKDIIGIETARVYSTKFIILFTGVPEKYIEKGKNLLHKKAMQANYKMVGSPLSINTQSLKIKHKELEQLLIKKWDEFIRTDKNSKM